MSDPDSRGERRSAVPALVVILTLLILVRGTPNVAEYVARLRITHSLGAIAANVAGLIALLCLLFVGIWRASRVTAAAGAVISLILVVTSGNGAAFPVAAGLLGFTLLAGDWAARLFRGREAEQGEIAISIAAGIVVIGVCLLLLGEVGLAKPLPLAAIALVLVFLRRRRISPLWRLVRSEASGLAAGPYSAIESVWLAVVVAAIAAAFLGALRPDVSFDALAYHLPEVRDFAMRGHVEPIANLFQSVLWRNYETFLGAGFLAGGVRVVRLLHFGIGLAAFASAATLARRLHGKGSGPLVLLALAAVPAVCAQLKETLVDLPAALLLTAAAAEIAVSDREPRRCWLAGFLFGGAVATKIFSLWGTIALLILIVRRRGTRRLLAFALCAALPLLPWFAWSQSRSGFFLSPYSDPLLKRGATFGVATDAPPKPWTRVAPSGVTDFLRLPYDRTFETVWFDRAGDGVTGFLPLLLVLGAIGWGRGRFALFCGAALAALAPWYLLSATKLLSPSIRFLIPLYPLYAVFTSLGFARLTERARGAWATAMALCLALLSIAFPAQFFAAPLDLKIALGRVSQEQGLSAYLPAYPLWKHVQRQDRVLLFGDWDRYHCPADYVVRDIDLPSMEDDPRRLWSELARRRITHIVYRSDTRRAKAMLASLGNCLELVERNGAAALYRVREDRADCPGPAPPRTGA